MEELENEIGTSGADGAETPQETPSTETSGQSEYQSLDPNAKYKHEDLEFTASELRSMVMRQQDYTRKTQEIAEERKFHSALQADIENVRRDPRLVAEFKRIYPQKYHSYLKYASSGSQTPSNETQATQNPKELLEQMLQEHPVIQELNNMKLSQAEKEVNEAFGKYNQQYPLADDRVVAAFAEQLMIQKQQMAYQTGDDPNKIKITDGEWNKLFKFASDDQEKRFNTHYKTKFEKQKEASKSLKETPAGGVPPGHRPREARTIREATQMFREDLGS